MSIAAAITSHPRLPYVTGALGALVIAFTAIFVKLAGATSSTTAVFRCLYAVPPLLLLAHLENRRFGPRTGAERRLAWFAGACLAADLVLWHYAIYAVGAGLSTVLANVQVVIVGLAAWALLGERPDRRIFVAVPVVLVGVVLISGLIGEGAYGSDPVLGVVCGVLSAISYAAFLLILRRGNRDTRRPAGPLLDTTLAAGLVSALIGFALGDLDLMPVWPAHGWLIMLALIGQVLGWLLISVSLPRLPAVITSLLLMFQPVATVLLALVILDETPSTLQIAGVTIVLSGILIATLARPRAARPEPMI